MGKKDFVFSGIFAGDNMGNRLVFTGTFTGTFIGTFLLRFFIISTRGGPTMPKKYILFVLVLLVVVGFGSYKMGDYYGYQAGQKYGCDRDCREELEKVKDVVNHMRISLDSVRDSLKNFSNNSTASPDLASARRYNAHRDSMLAKDPNNVLLRAIVSYDDNGNPVFDDDYIKCKAGLGPCK